MIADLGTVTSKVFARWGWKCVPFVTLWWTLFWPIGLVWLALSLIAHYQRSDRSRGARAERRASRLLSSYPPRWRMRYGEEFVETVCQAVLDGHGGLRVELNIARESTIAWWETDRRAFVTLTCWCLCWLPLVAQSLAPLGIKLSGGTYRGWFLALFLPVGFQWLVVGIMFTVGVFLLAVAVRGLPTLRTTGA